MPVIYLQSEKKLSPQAIKTVFISIMTLEWNRKKNREEKNYPFYKDLVARSIGTEAKITNSDLCIFLLSLAKKERNVLDDNLDLHQSHKKNIIESIKNIKFYWLSVALWTFLCFF